MKDDIIYRKAAIEALEEPPKVPDTWTDECAIGEREQWEKDVKVLNSLPSVQPERKKGEWIIYNVVGVNRHPTNRYFAKCSECGTLTMEWRGNVFPPRLRFCTNCGAYNERRHRNEST